MQPRRFALTVVKAKSLCYIFPSPTKPPNSPTCIINGETRPTMVFSLETHPTILVVDDSEDTRLMLRRALESKDYRVLEATNGEEAVEVARRESPDLILMDLNMPFM